MGPPPYEDMVNKNVLFYIQDELNEDSNQVPPPTYEDVVQVIPPYSASLGMRRNGSMQFCLHI